MSEAPPTVPYAAPPRGPVPARRPPLGGGSLAMVVIGSILGFFGLLAVLGGVALAAVGNSRDADGYLTAGPVDVRTDAYALSVPEVGVDVRGPDEAYARRLLGTVRIRATAADPAKPVFVGIAPTRDVDAYLDGVGHTDFTVQDIDPVDVRYTPHDGGAPGSAPGTQAFWDVSDQGTGQRTVEWQVASGDWSVVVMNADGSAGVAAEVDLGGRVPALRWAVVAVFAVGGILLVGGTLLVVLPLAARRRR